MSVRKNSKAIVTINIGEKYRERWRRVCEENWRVYANRHGYDLISIESPLDDSERAQRRSPAWQKCMILSQEFSLNYERIIWIDSDILINASIAPCIASNLPVDKVGAVNEWSIPSPELFTVALNRLFESWGDRAVVNRSTHDYYKNYGFSSGFDQIVQTGVLVLSPRHHRQILEKVYHEYDDKGGPEWNYEMRPLSYELLKADMVEWIDYRFNALWPIYKILYYPFLMNDSTGNGLISRVKRRMDRISGISPAQHYSRACATTVFNNNYFMHFSGTQDEMELVNSKIISWADI